MQNILQKVSRRDEERSKCWNEYHKLYKKMGKIHDVTFSDLRSEFEKYNTFSKKYKKIEEEEKLCWEIYEEALNGMNTWASNEMFEKLFTLDKRSCSTLYVTRKKGAQLKDDNCCSMCMESHDIKHIVKTSCGHYFGKQCFASLMKHQYYKNNSKTINCPNCRCQEFTLQQFKYKK